jgi:RNase H-fold protein (predicted Holliday junction resolvase)
MALLALDLGTKRTGIAVSTSGRLVTPVGTINSVPRSTFTTELQRLLKKYEVTTIVVGDSGLSNFGGAPGEVQMRLTQLFQLPIVVTEEKATTKQAQAVTGRRDHADTEAACQILERYLEDHDEPLT